LSNVYLLDTNVVSELRKPKPHGFGIFSFAALVSGEHWRNVDERALRWPAAADHRHTLLIWFAGLQAKRADFIRTYSFPAGLADRLGTHYPQLTAPDRQLVEAALRQFFLAYLKGGRKFVSMPSQSAEQAVRAAPSRYSADRAARAAPP